MNGSVRIGRILGVPLRMHWSVPLLIVLLAYSLGRETLPVWTPGHSTAVYTVAAVVGALLLMVSLLAHEAAHAATAKRRGIDVEDVTLWALGGVTKMGRPDTARVAFVVAVSGPLVSLVVGGIAYGVGIGAAALDWTMPAAVLVWVGAANVLLGVFNLLPAAPLDGGRVVQSLLWWRTGDRDRAERAAGRSGQVLGALLMIGGWISFVRGNPNGLWLMLIGFFVLIVAGAERRQAVLTTTLRGVRVADAMSSPVTTGPDWMTVERFITEVASLSRPSVLPLVDFEGRPSGVVAVARLAKVPPARRQELRVRDVAIPRSQCTFAAPDEMLVDVLRRRSAGVAALPVLVVEGEQLLGIVTAHDVNRLSQGRALRETAHG